MGSDRFYPEERPQHPVTVSPLWIDPAPVTNADFARFVQASGYLTWAERDERGSLVFRTPAMGVAWQDWRLWWTSVREASWRHPEGAGSNIDARMEHPVVHVCWHDEHRAILDCIRQQDAEGARRAMRSRIEKAPVRMMEQG